MKRLWLMLALVSVSGVAAHTLYTIARPAKTPEACSMEWLAAQLDLTPAQRDAVWSIHQRRCSEICQLANASAECPPEQAPRAMQVCQAATEKLITEVSAELSPDQRR